MTGITTTQGDKQRNALMLFMREFSKEKSYLPTIADMASGLGWFRTAVVWHLEVLRDEGRIDYVDGHMARSLKVLGR
jgi:SOS-response transcriptional repressor LexA